MKLLLDTHLLLWLAAVSGRLSRRARVLVQDPSNTIYFSSVSIWEVVIKAAQGRPDFTFDAVTLRMQLLQNGYLELPLTGEHVLRVASLPSIHKDLFDRVLIAQAQIENITLLTSDETVSKYPGPILKV